MKKMKLEIEFENYEELNKKLFSLLYCSDKICYLPDKCLYTVDEIKRKIKFYAPKYEENYYDIIKNGRTISRAINYTQCINKLVELSWNIKCIIVQNSTCMSDIYIFS